MIYLMHICGTQAIAAAATFPRREDVLRSVAAGRHLSTLAFSETGSRSHFWAAGQSSGRRRRHSSAVGGQVVCDQRRPGR